MPTCPAGFSLFTYPPSGHRIGPNVFDDTTSYVISPNPGINHVTFEDGKAFETPIICKTHIWALDGSKVKIYDATFETAAFSNITTSISGGSFNWTYTIANSQTGQQITRVSRAQNRPVLMTFLSVKARNSAFFVPIWYPHPTSLSANGFKVFQDGTILLGTTYPRIIYRHITLIRRISDNRELARYDVETPFYTNDPVIIGKSSYSSAQVFTSQGLLLRGFDETPSQLRFENYYQGITVSTNIPSTLNFWWPNISIAYKVLDRVTFNDGRFFVLDGFSPNDVLPYSKTKCFRCEPPDRGDDHCFTCPPLSNPTGGSDSNGCFNIRTSTTYEYTLVDMMCRTTWTGMDRSVFDQAVPDTGISYYDIMTPILTSQPGYYFKSFHRYYSKVISMTYYEDQEYWPIVSWNYGYGNDIPPNYRDFSNGSLNNRIGGGSVMVSVAWKVRYMLLLQTTNSCPGYDTQMYNVREPNFNFEFPADTAAPPTPQVPPPPCKPVIWVATLIRFNLEAAFEAALDYIPIPGIRVPSIPIPQDSPYKPLFDVLASIFSGSPISADQIRQLYDLLLSTLTLVLPPNIREFVQLLLTLCTPEPLHNISGTACGEVTVKKVSHQSFLMSDSASKLISDDDRLIFIVLNSGYI